MDNKWKLFTITVLIRNTTSDQELILTKNVIAENSAVGYKKVVDYCKKNYPWVDKIKPLIIDIPDMDIII